MKCRWNRKMLNLCSIVAAILKMATAKNCPMSGINSGHHYLPTYQIWMISDNIESLPLIFYAMFWQPFWKWQTSRKFWKRRIALPRLVIGTSRTVGSAKKFVRITSSFGGGEFTKTLRKVCTCQQLKFAFLLLEYCKIREC
jgi:hypothetical protein